MNFNRSIPQALFGSALVAAAFSAHAVTLVGITSSNEVARIDTTNIAAATRTAITGLAAGDRFVGIDLRPADNRIYGITLSNKIYTLDEATGATTFVAALSLPIVDPTLGYGIDFNPVADFNGAASLRFVTSAGNNYAVNASTGAVGNTASMIPTGFSAVSYTNSMPNPSAAPASTGLYYINADTDTLSFAPTAFNSPTIGLIGSLGVDVLHANGFDVQADGTAYGAFNIDAGSSLVTGLYGIDLATGAATSLGQFNGTLSGLTSSAVAPIPEPETYALMLAGLGVVGFMARRRRTA